MGFGKTLGRLPFPSQDLVGSNPHSLLSSALADDSYHCAILEAPRVTIWPSNSRSHGYTPQRFENWCSNKCTHMGLKAETTQMAIKRNTELTSVHSYSDLIGPEIPICTIAWCSSIKRSKLLVTCYSTDELLIRYAESEQPRHKASCDSIYRKHPGRLIHRDRLKSRGYKGIGRGMGSDCLIGTGIPLGAPRKMS